MQRMLILFVAGDYITQSIDIEVLRKRAKKYGCAAKICDARGHIIEKIEGGANECAIKQLLREKLYYKQRKARSSVK